MKITRSQGMTALLALVLSGCGRHETPSVPAAAPAAQQEKAPVSVETAAVEERPMPRYLQIIGELRSGLDSSVAADASGKVVEANLERGSKVKAGDVLIKLDDRQAALALREAEALVTQAQSKVDLTLAEWKRNEPLAKTKAIADADFQRMTADNTAAQADLEAAQARRDTARKNVADTIIRAPFDGTVAERMVSLGEYVQANTQVARVVATDKLRLLMNIPETDLGSLKQEQEVAFQVPAYPGESFKGTVKFVGAVVREATRDLLVEAEVPNADGRLRQGMFAEGRLHVGDAKVLVIPTVAIRMDAGTKRVLVVDQDQIVERLVDTGDAHDSWTHIVQGLGKGDKVVVKAGADAVDGARIKVAMAGESEKANGTR